MIGSTCGALVWLSVVLCGLLTEAWSEDDSLAPADGVPDGILRRALEEREQVIVVQMGYDETLVVQPPTQGPEWMPQSDPGHKESPVLLHEASAAKPPEPHVDASMLIVSHREVYDFQHGLVFSWYSVASALRMMSLKQGISDSRASVCQNDICLSN